MRASRALLVSLLLTVATISVLSMCSPLGHHGVRREAAVAATVGSASQRALGVLRRWDHRRAAAWARGDRRALASLYVRGSASARQDLRMLSAYRARGLRVRWMRRQVLEVRVRRSTGRALVLLVTDRLVGGVTAGPGVRAALPQSRLATREISLRRVGSGWRVVEVYDS